MLTQQGPENFQLKEGPFAKKEGRSLSKHWFETLSSNIAFAKKIAAIFTMQTSSFLICLFLFSRSKSSFCNEDGLSSWRKLNPRIYEHARSPGQRNSMRECLEFAARLEKLRVTDYELQKHVASEKKKSRLIVKRIVDVVFLLARQNIALRSHRDEGVSNLVNHNAYATNCGNFLKVTRLLADYDLVLFEHLQKVRNRPNKVNYLYNKSQKHTSL